MWTRLFVLVAASAAGAYAGIRAHEASKSEGSSVAIAVEAPVDAPVGLVAEAIVVAPDATWRKAQATIGGVVLLAPPTFGGIVAAIARVPALASVVDGGSPAYGVSSNRAWVIATRAISAQRARSTLLAGTDALAFDSRAGSLDVFRSSAQKPAFVALAGSYVLVGSDRDAITTLGPYAYRTLPTRPLPQGAVFATMNDAGLSGPIRDFTTARIDALRKFLVDKDDEARGAHGRVADLADPKAFVALIDAVATRYANAVTSMKRVDLALDVDDEGATAKLTLVPKDGDAKTFVESFEGAGTAPLAATSADALATLFWRSGEAERDDAAKAGAEFIARALGARVPADDEAKIGESLTRIARARAGWSTVSVFGGASAGIVARFPASDASAITSAIEADVAIAARPSWAKWEHDALSVAKIDHTPNAATITTRDMTLLAAWTAQSGEADVAIGLDSRQLLAPAAHTLANDAKVSAWLHDLGGDVAWALVARPLLIGASPRSDAALVALTRKGDALVAHARAPSTLLRQFVAGF